MCYAWLKQNILIICLLSMHSHMYKDRNNILCYTSMVENKSKATDRPTVVTHHEDSDQLYLYVPVFCFVFKTGFLSVALAEGVRQGGGGGDS